jgi:type IX secretion system PorP/SprF family membrane protein
MKKWFLYISACLLVAQTGTAQDMHSSQPSLAQVHFNPATTGLYNGTLRVAARYRAQWISVPVNYRTAAAEADRPLLERGGTRLSAGIRVAHDIVGDGQLTYARGGVSLSAIRRIGERISLGVGADLSAAQRTVAITGLSFKNQWIGDIYDPNAPNKEPLGPKTGLIPLISTGVAAVIGSPDEPRNRIEIGAALHQANRPTVSFDDDRSSRLAPRLAVQTNLSRKINAVIDAVGYAQYQRQGSYAALVAGTGARLIVGTDGGYAKAVSATIGWRAGDAIIPAMQLEYGPWIVGLSYDVNTSAFQTATQRRGAWELACVYRVVPVPKVPEWKVCPVF